MIEAKAAEAFWQVVIACLARFHGFSESEAEEATLSLRKRIESPPDSLSSDIFYHAEPFDVACDVAKKPLRLENPDYRHQYDVILNEHRW
jgi:hypothetical protein